MFVLDRISTHVSLDPSALNDHTHDAIASSLKDQYTDRIVPDVGLVISVYDLLYIGEGCVYHSQGHVYYSVVFRAVVFRPFVSELLVGRIRQMSDAGLRVSVGFFDDIFVPPELLQQPAVWHGVEKEWCWKMEDENEEEQGGSSSLYYSVGGQIRFKVHTVKFSSEDGVPRCSVVGRADSTGLGMVAWEWGE
jgi:DNA-directed RNA polymerase III subunit RPC8